ncbi:MAG: YfcE family phosphodiesterase [Thermoflexales bacterium]|nr:YfcE family phosphodiesterase [Thermoflexales bacterium]
MSTHPTHAVLDLTAAPPRVIGVLSDSHIPFRLPALPAEALDRLAGCDLILHAGDLEDPRLLAQLRTLAPAHAVRGNIHWSYSTGTHDLDLPETLTVRLGSRTLWMTHGHLNFGYTMVDKAVAFTRRPTLEDVNQTLIGRLSQARPADADIVIFGHSHNPCQITRAGVLYFNPGAIVGARGERGETRPASLGRLTFNADGTFASDVLVLDSVEVA